MSKRKNASRCDRNGKEIQEGDILNYYAGEHRDILQKYVAESLSEGPDHYKAGPNRFRAVGHDGRLQNTRLSLFCLDEWSEVVGNIRETPIDGPASEDD